jgi:hypothetical protein
MSPGKDQGLFAITAISKGTRIIAEVPLVLTESRSPLGVYLQILNLARTAPEQREVFENLHHIGHLPAPAQTTQNQSSAKGATPLTRTRLDVYIQLLDDSNWEAIGQYGTPRRRVLHLKPEQGGKALALFDNNYFPIRNAAGTKNAWAVFEHASRLNHSCIPNCYASWNRTIGRLCVQAIRDIKEGEELYIAYRSPDLIFERPEARSRELSRV